MATENIEENFHEQVSGEICLVPGGVDRYRVLTPFQFDDGDHIVVVLKKEDGRWILSDEAHTYMRLTYDISENSLRGGTRQRIISNTLSMFGVEDRDGELILPVPDERYGEALYSFVQTILKISDVSFLSRGWYRPRKRPHPNFRSDFRALMKESVPKSCLEFDWFDPERDHQRKYKVDCRINGMRQPIFVHALANDSATRDATIALHKFRQWKIPYRPLAIFKDRESINRAVLDRFSEVVDAQFPNIPDNRERIARYLKEHIAS